MKFSESRAWVPLFGNSHNPVLFSRVNDATYITPDEYIFRVESFNGFGFSQVLFVLRRINHQFCLRKINDGLNKQFNRSGIYFFSIFSNNF